VIFGLERRLGIEEKFRTEIDENLRKDRKEHGQIGKHEDQQSWF